jgi:hypothetical protein
MCFIQSLSRSWHTDLDYGSYCLPDLEIGLRAGVPGREGMLTIPRHLIPPLVFQGVSVSLDYIMWIFPFTWSGHWFGQRIFFRLIDLSALVMTAGFSIYLIWTHKFWLQISASEMELMADVTGQQGMLTSLKHLIPPLVYSEVRVCPILWFVFPTRFIKLMIARYLCHF